jgi:hypothetical protein
MESRSMISVKILSTAAALALLLPIAAPGASYAQANKIGRAAAGGAAYYRAGAAAPATRMVGAAPAASVPAARPSGGVAWNGGRTWNGGGDWRGYRHDRDRDRRFIPGAVAGAVIGGALASGAYTYYGAPVYYDAPAYYDDQQVDDVPVGEDSAAYCAQNYRSYDPASGTYLGVDGYRHPCP